MAIKDGGEDAVLRPISQKRNLLGVDHGVSLGDGINPLARMFKSTTSSIPAGERPHILSDARMSKNGFHTLISVGLEPTLEKMPIDTANTPYECTTQYYNHTNRDIRVTDRHNLTVTLPRLSQHWNPHRQEFLMVRKIHRFAGAETAKSVLYNYQCDRAVLSIQDDERQQVLNRILQLQETGSLRNNNAHVEVIIDRIIPIRLFTDYLAIYVHDLDLMFRQEAIDIGTPHPASQDAILRGELLKRFEDLRVAGVMYNIIDNESMYASRYICLGKEVHLVPTSRDSGKQSGIYITRLDNTNVEMMHVSLAHYPLEKASELGIFATKEEAESNGHLNDTHKLAFQEGERRLATLKQQIATADAERQESEARLNHARTMEKTTTGFVADQLNHKALLEELLIKLRKREDDEKYDRLQSERKDYYEERSTNRKDSSEVLKWVPTVITACLSIATLVFTMQSKTSK